MPELARIWLKIVKVIDLAFFLDMPFLPQAQNAGNMIIVANLNFWRGPKFKPR